MPKVKRVARLLLALLAASVLTARFAMAADSQDTARSRDFWNFETASVHALDSSTDGKRVALAHTVSGRVHWYRWQAQALVEEASIYACVDPTSVRFRNERELWVVCQISDRVVVIDIIARRIMASLRTADRPADVVFAGKPQRAYVSLMRDPALQIFDPVQLSKSPKRIALRMAEPRSLATNGRQVFVLAYRGGNGTTVLPGAVVDRQQLSAQRNVVGHPETPTRGVNPPTNADGKFKPPINPALPRAPAVGLIVRRDSKAVWRDDQQRDWSQWVSGVRAPIAGRVVGWDMPDHDLAVVDTDTQKIRYRSALLTHGLAMVQTGSTLALAGMEAINQQRFEPNLRGRYMRHWLRQVDPQSDAADTPIDLNAHLDNAGAGDANQSVAEPRALAYDTQAQRLYVAAAGSARVLRVNAAGERIEPALLEVPAGPSDLHFDPAQQRLLVWSRYASSLSVVDATAWKITQSINIADPTPQAVRTGRRWLTDARLTSANGTQSCANCHLDAHSDRLAWDLGDPAASMETFGGNCITDSAKKCADWHPMKGPMVTQPLIDVIGHEPFHWRGDRAGLRDFAKTYTGLLGRAKAPSDAEFAELSDYLASIRAQPNPYRSVSDALPSNIKFDAAIGLGTPREQQWPTANAARGLDLFRTAPFAAPFQCINCHSLPTGYAASARIFSGGALLPLGSHGEAHLGMSSIAGLSQGTFKIPGLRDLYDKLDPSPNRAIALYGVGLGADGSLLTLTEFLRLRNLRIPAAQDEADIMALLLAFGGTQMPRPAESSVREALGPPGHNTHAAVGSILDWDSDKAAPDALAKLILAAKAGALTLLAQNSDEPALLWRYLPDADRFNNGSQQLTLTEFDRLRASSPVRFIAAPPSLDRD